MNVEIFEANHITKLQKAINDWIEAECYDLDGEQIKEVVDIKLVSDDNAYVSMIIYKFI